MEIAQYAKALAVIDPTLLLALPAKALASNRCSLTKARCHLDESCDDSLSDLTDSRLHWAATNLRPGVPVRIVSPAANSGSSRAV